MRRTIIGVLATATLALVAFAGPASADPAVAQPPTQVAHKTQRVFHNGGFVDLAVAIDLGNTDADAAFEVASPVARFTGGTGFLRGQIVNERLGNGARVINDYFPSKDSFDNPPAGPTTDGRNNTICRQGPTPPVPPANVVTLNLLDAGCVKNFLHSVADYEPDAGVGVPVRGFGDYTPLDSQGCPTVANRSFFEIRWSDNVVIAYQLRTPDVTSNGPGCP